jgi:hypothetical protein
MLRNTKSTKDNSDRAFSYTCAGLIITLPSSTPQKADISFINYYILISFVKLTTDTTETRLFHTQLQVSLARGKR